MKVFKLITTIAAIGFFQIAKANNCDLAISARSAFGGFPFGERFKLKVINLLEEKGYNVVSFDNSLRVETQTPNKLYIDADYGFPCGSGVTTSDEIFRNHSFASARLESGGESMSYQHTVKNLPLLPTEVLNMHTSTKNVIKQLPNCTTNPNFPSNDCSHKH